jgi:hypothetical protein
MTAFALVLGLSWAAATNPRARAGDDESIGDRQARLQKVQAQKTEKEVRDALAGARSAGARDPVKAVRILKKTLARLEDDDNLSDRRRTTLIRRLKAAIREWSLKADSRAKRLAARDDSNERARDRRSEDARNAKERVRRIARDLRDRRDILRESKNLRRERERGFTRVQLENEKGMVVPKGEITFPKDWHKRVAKRKRIQMTKKEIILLRVLNSVISVNFKDNKFEDVIDYLQTKTKQTILVDKQALKDKDIDYETPISLKVNKITVRTLLRKILNDLGLTYVVKDESIYVTTLENAKKMMVVRAYHVGDLIGNNDPRFGPIINALQKAENARALVALIKSTIEPDSWAGGEGEGTGTITYNAATDSIIVKQSAEFHYRLKASLGGW